MSQVVVQSDSELSRCSSARARRFISSGLDPAFLTLSMPATVLRSATITFEEESVSKLAMSPVILSQLCVIYHILCKRDE